MQDLLPDFKKILLDRHLVPEKNAPFYAYWANKFLSFSDKNEDMNQDLKIAEFLDHLKKHENIDDWQIRQAEEALRLYLDHYLGGDTSSLSRDNPQKGKRFKDSAQILASMRQAIRLKHYSYKTEQSYIDWAKRFISYTSKLKKKYTEDMDSGDVRDYLSYLAVNQRVSSSTQNQAFNALLFLFRDVLGIGLSDLGKTVRAKRGPKLPVVLSIQEVQNIFKHMQRLDLLMAKLIYGSGLRLMELARLRVQDIDFDSNIIVVRSGKGDKDRTTVLPHSIKDDLKKHLESAKAIHEKDLEAGYGEVYLPDALSRKYPNAAKEWGWQYVFPASKLSVDPRSNKVRRHHVGEKTIQNSVREAVRKAGIAKHATVHTLRHSFATHLLMKGVNLREIQELLGHKNVVTTMVYTHVLREMANMPESPLDLLPEIG
jgi:integron integrase